MSAVEEVLDDLTEIVEETAKVATDMSDWRCGLSKKQHLMQLVVVGAVAGTIGGLVAYKVGKKMLEAKYEQIVQQEIAEAKSFYSHLHKQGDLSTPEGAVKKLMPRPEVAEAADALRRYQGEDDGEGDDEPVEEVEVEVTSLNVFKQSQVDDDFDFNEEVKNRTPDRPYIISAEEFLEGELNFSQTTITYYAGDGTLADDQDQEIPIADPVVGEENLSRFGHGSGDARVVYVRNERLSTDFEILKHDGKFAHEVLGFEHSDGTNRDRQRRSQPRKFRGGDE